MFDHVLVSSGVLPLVKGLHYGRAGADFPTVLSGDPTRPERLSDHDAPVAYLRFPQADLAVSKTASPASVLAGSTLTSTIVVANDGPDPATTVALTDTLPAGTTFRSLTAPPGWTCTAPPPGGSGGFTCTTPGLAAGSSAAFGLEVDVDCDLLTGTALANVASVAALTDDPDAADNAATATVSVSNPPPVVTGVAATPSVLWPPNHEMVEVGLAYEATDTCGLAVCRLAVTSDEPANGLGDGDAAPDWTVVDARTVRLRAERAGGGDGRVYTIAVTCADAAGGETVATTAVYVPKSQKQ